MLQKNSFQLLLIFFTVSIGSSSGLEAKALSERIDPPQIFVENALSGQSQKSGYELSFEDGGSLHLWGMARMNWSPSSNNSKLSKAYNEGIR